jgi:hypothetical protein
MTPWQASPHLWHSKNHLAGTLRYAVCPLFFQIPRKERKELTSVAEMVLTPSQSEGKEANFIQKFGRAFIHGDVSTSAMTLSSKIANELS